MSAVLSDDSPTLAPVVGAFGVGELVNYRRAGHGIENDNYFVTTRRDGRTHEYVLTFMRKDPSAGDAYVPLMDALDDAGLPVAPPLATLEGARHHVDDGRTVLLQHRLPGQHTVNPTARQIAAIARFLARLHVLTPRSPALPEYPRDLAWLAARAAEVAGEVPFAEAATLSTALTHVGSLLARGDCRTLPRGAMHGDLFRDNALFNEHGLTGVLDFHHAADGWWIYDLAVVANDWCTDASGRLDPDRATVLLSAYHRIRPLAPAEVWFFPVFALYAATAFWLSRLAVAARAEPGVRQKDPDEFKRIVTHHLSHQFYLDQRLLD